MTKTTDAELLFLPDSEQLRFLPEGPTPAGPGKFSWVAIQHGADARDGSLNIYDIESATNQHFPLPGRPGFAKPTSREGTYVIGLERELGCYDTTNETWETWKSGVDEGVEGTIINDGTVYANNLVFGTKDLEFKTKKAGLYLFRGSDQRLIKLRDDQVCSNGKDVINSGGGCFLIDIDSPTKKIVRYRIDMESGAISNEELIADFQDLPSVPDGMTMTPDEQSVIVSFYNPNPAEYGETRQYSIYNGELEHVWRTPGSPQATCPVLLEMPDRSIKLVITTAVEHMPDERRGESPNAGGIFIADTSFRSPPITPHFPIK